MRCNRKIACFAVTPRKKVVGGFNITEIWQLRRRQKAKVEIAGKMACDPLKFEI